ncbi:hypothetical protein L3X38_029729 [Prunus dulcis]|uniref:Uncharacterized protein n=1 Tax=Prunus dulcis TaxID=3755 RepID=A0AAD4VUN9_PRUDU|nr:hypothetical protein L3X38_029729 [Prunus dulcis]
MEYRCHWNNRSRSQGDRNYRKRCRTSSDDHDNDAKVQAIRSGGTDAAAAAADDDMGLERAKKLLATLQNKKMIKDIHHKDHDHTAAAAYSTTSPQAIPSFATADQKNINIHEIPSSSTTCPTCCLPKEPKLVFSEIRTFVEGPHFEKQESRFIKRKKKIEKIKAEEQKAREYAMEVLAKLVPSHIKFTVL